MRWHDLKTSKSFHRVEKPWHKQRRAELRPGSQWETSCLEKARQCHLRRRFQQEELPEVFLCFALLAHSELEQASHRPGVGILRIESDDAIVISKSLVEISFLSENEGTIEIGRDQIRFQTYGTVKMGLCARDEVVDPTCGWPVNRPQS